MPTLSLTWLRTVLFLLLTAATMPAAITLSGGALPNGQVGALYNTTVSATGATGSVTYALASGVLPPGMSLASTTGVLSGTLTIAGNYSFSIRATDSTSATATAAFSLLVNGGSDLQILTTSLPSGQILVGYTGSISAVGGTSPYTFGTVPGSGNLPNGLTLTSTGLLLGTPNVAGTFNFVVEVTDSLGAKARANYSLLINSNLLAIATTTLPNAALNTAYNFSLVATGGAAPYSFGYTGSLPPGMTLSTGGILNGTPSALGTYNFTVSVFDTLSGTAQRSLTLVVTNSVLSITTSFIPAAQVNQPYSSSLSATGGTTPYTFTVFSGGLPSGITLNSNGALSGTPTIIGNSTVTIQVTDSASPPATSQATYNFSVNANTLQISTTSLPNGVVGTSYFANLTATNGTAPYSFSLLSSSLPQGLNLAANGTISGTPTVSGTSSFTVRVQDNSGAVSQATLSISIVSSSLAFTSTALPNGTVNTTYSGTIAATGGLPNYSYSLVGGTLPTGLTLAANGLISGTPTQSGNFSFQVRVTDAASATTTGTFSINVLNGGFAITTQSVPPATLNVNYQTSFAAAGGTAPYTYIFFGGTLPPNMFISASGLLTGVPIQQGTFNFTVRVTDQLSNNATANFTLVVNTSGITLTPNTLNAATVGQSYTQALSASGGTPNYTFSIVSGSLPTGIQLSSDGILQGTPTTAGTYTFSVRVTDAAAQSSTFSYALVSQASSLTITTTSLPTAQLGIGYNNTVTASGGSPNYTFSVIGGNFPPGLTLAANGTITGAPSVAGTYSFTVRVLDAQSQASQTTLTIVVNNSGTLTITTNTLPNAALNQSYNANVSATGGTAPYTFAVNSGVLPLGLSLSNTGQISGTPTAAGTYNFVVRVNDVNGATSLSSLSILVGSNALQITNASLPLGQVGQPYSATLSATGGLAPYTYTISSGVLPTGVTLNALNGQITGVPSIGGTFPVTYRVTDNTGASAFLNLSMVINSGQLSFVTQNLPGATINSNYTTTLQAAGGLPPYSFAVVGGSLPAGLTLSTIGDITGTPTVVGLSSITFRVTDSTGNTSTQSLNLAVSQNSLTINQGTLPVAGNGQNYTTTITATGGTLPYSFSIASGTFPAGLILSANGSISGIPTQPGTYQFVVRLVDGSSTVALASFTIQVSSSVLQIITSTLPTPRLGQIYSQAINTSGGVAPLNFFVSGGSLPAGLQLSQSGILAGTPSQAGSFTFTVRVSDATQFAVTQTYTVTVQGNPPTLNTTPLPSGVTGQIYSTAFTASGGTPPYTFQSTGGLLPPGLALNPNGVLSGTPSQTGTYTVTVRVLDAQSLSSDGTFSITISAGAAPLSIDAFAPPPALLNFPYNFSPTASGGSGGYRWTISQGALPSGLTLNANTGAFSGSFLAPGVYTFFLRVTDSSNTVAESRFAFNVLAGTRLTAGTVGQSYTGQIPAPSTGVGPFTYAMDASAFGSFPDGLSLAGNGSITGTPTAAGEHTFGVLIRSASGVPTRTTVTLPVVASGRVSITNVSLPGGNVGINYGQTLTATGGRAPYTWTIVAGQLPQGLSLNSATGNITGAPALAGNSVVTVRATDADNNSANAYYTLSVLANAPALSAATSAASYASNGVAPGEIVTLFGGGIGPAALTTFTLQSGSLPTAIAGTRVLFDGVAAPLLYSSNGQVSAIAPFGLASQAVTRVVVEYNNVQTASILLPVLSSKPALFTADGSGQGPGAILNENGSVNTAGNPAAKGSVVVLYMTGGGSMTPAGVDGAVAAATSSLTLPTTVTIGGQPAEVLYAGNAPGLVQGVIQVNVKTSLATPSGAQLVSVRIGPNSTTANATVAIQ